MATATDRRSSTPPPSHPAVDFELDADHEAHEPPEARGRRPRRGAAAGLAGRRRAGRTPASPTCPTLLDAGDLARRQHVGDGPRRARRHAPTGEPVVVHFSDRAARRPLAGRGAPARRRRQHRAAALVDRDRRRRRAAPAAAASQLLAPFAGSPRLWLATLARRRRRRLDGTCAAHGRPIRYRYVPARLAARRVPDRLRREPGSAEMPSAAPAVHARGRHRPRPPRRRHRAARCCTPACRRSRATRRRTPSATGCRRPPPRCVNATHARGRPGRSPSAPPSCGRSRP